MCTDSGVPKGDDFTGGPWFGIRYASEKYQNVPQSMGDILVEGYETGYSGICSQVFHMPTNQSRASESSWLDAASTYPSVEVGPHHHRLRSGTFTDN